MEVKISFLKRKESQMNMKSKSTAVFIALASIVSLALITPAFAEWNSQNTEMQHKHAGNQDFMKKLNLSPEQKSQITKQQDMNKEKENELRDKMHAKRLELKQELEKSEVDTNKVNAIIVDIKTLTGEQLDLRVNSILAMKQILTPEQFKKLQDMKEEKYKEGKKKEKREQK